MTVITVQAGSSQTYTADTLGQKVEVAGDGGSVANVIHNGTLLRALGPTPFRRSYGPLAAGDVLIVSCISGLLFTEISPSQGGSSGPASALTAAQVTSLASQANNRGIGESFQPSTQEVVFGRARSKGSLSYSRQLLPAIKVLAQPTTPNATTTAIYVSEGVAGASDSPSAAKRGFAGLLVLTASGGDATWTSGFSSTAFVAGRVLNIPIELEDDYEGRYAPSIQLKVTTSKGTVTCVHGSGALRPGWNNLVVWDPAGPIHKGILRPGAVYVNSAVAADVFSVPITSIAVSILNAVAGAQFRLATFEIAEKYKPIILPTFDDSDGSAISFAIPTLEAAGMKGNVRIGGAREDGFGDETGYLAPRRAIRNRGNGIYCGSFNRVGLSSTSPLSVIMSEIQGCLGMARSAGFDNLTLFSTIANSSGPIRLMRQAGRACGLTLIKNGNGAPINILNAEGVDDPYSLFTTGMGGGGTFVPTAGAAGATVITAAATGHAPGMRLSGTGIDTETYITDVYGSAISISKPLLADVTGATITRTDSYLHQKYLVDAVIALGGLLCTFAHDFIPAAGTPSGTSFPQEEYTALVAYMKTFTDAGAVDVMAAADLDVLMGLSSMRTMPEQPRPIRRLRITAAKTLVEEDRDTRFSTGNATQAFTVNAGMPRGYGLTVLGPSTWVAGSGVTVTDNRVTGSAAPLAELISTGYNTYALDGYAA